MMTKKDYKKFAEMLAEQYKDNLTLENLVSAEEDKLLALRIAFIFAEDNPHFDRERFLKACGLS